jgi:serine/threonine protein kinase, bacterial
MRLRRTRLGAAVLLTSAFALVGSVSLPAASLAATGARDAMAGSDARAAWDARTSADSAAAVRRFGEVATIGVGRLPTSVAVDQHTGTVWVVNSLDGTVSEISEARRAVVATIKVGVSPVGVAADPKTGTVWVTCLGPFNRPQQDDTVAMISEATGKVVARIKVGRAPFGVAADPRTGTVWVADANSYSVSEISEAHRAVAATFHTGADGAPDSIAVDPVRGLVWVGKLGGGVGEISEASKSVIATVRVDPGPRRNALNAIAVDSTVGTPWVASDYYDGSNYYSYASQLDQVHRKVLASVLVPKAGVPSNIADGIAVDPATGTVWVAENGANTLTLISAGSRQVARNLLVGDEPVAVAVDPVTSTAWVVNNYDGSVSEYAYGSPRFTTGSQLSFPAGVRATFQVHTRGYPIAVMTVHGTLPPGLRVRVGSGTVVISGTPARSAVKHTYQVVVSADNGVGNVSDQYEFSQVLTIKIT